MAVDDTAKTRRRCLGTEGIFERQSPKFHSERLLTTLIDMPSKPGRERRLADLVDTVRVKGDVILDLRHRFKSAITFPPTLTTTRDGFASTEIGWSGPEILIGLSAMIVPLLN